MSDQKTEKPTPQRRQKAREQGQVARSRDLSSTLAVSGAFGLVAWQGFAGIEAWRNLLRHTFDFSVAKLFHRPLHCLSWTAWTLANASCP